MKKQTKSALGKIALILGGAAVLDGVAGSGSRSANVATPAKADTPILTAERFKELISSDQELQAVLRSMFPQTSVQDVVTNINNSYTLEGVSYLTFGGSLLVNGALENLNLYGFTNIDFGDYYKGFNSIKVSNNYSYYSQKLIVRKDRLYRFSSYYKSTVQLSNFIYLANFDINGASIAKNSFDSSLLPAPSANFAKIEKYFGGIGNLTMNFGETCFKVELFIESTTGVSQLNQSVFKEIDLSEAVPSNLPWLPAGQEVKDPTTGDRGYFDGTVIEWYTMA